MGIECHLCIMWPGPPNIRPQGGHVQWGEQVAAHKNQVVTSGVNKEWPDGQVIWEVEKMSPGRPLN